MIFNKNNELKSKKILYVDPLSPNGHINFNKIYIDALLKIFDTVDFVFKNNYINKLSIHKAKNIYIIPDKFYVKSRYKIVNRYNLYKINRYIKKHCNVDKYDYVIFSSYDAISLYLCNFKRELILINHNNIRGLTNPIKLYIFKNVANKNINIVFEDYIKEYLLSLNISNVFRLCHGVPKPFDTKLIDDNSLSNEFDYLNKFKYIIFSPSNSSSDNIFLNNLITDSNFKLFLHQNDILFIIKSNQIISRSVNVKIINSYLSDLQYQYLFFKSNLIILCYPNSFVFRVSAILLECMTNNKLCLISDIPSLNIYKNYFNYNPYFKTSDELQENIKDLLISHQFKSSPYKDLSNYKPDFHKLFNSLEVLKININK